MIRVAFLSGVLSLPSGRYGMSKSFAAGIAAVTLAATIKVSKFYARRFALRTNHIHQPPVDTIHEPSCFHSRQGDFCPDRFMCPKRLCKSLFTRQRRDVQLGADLH